MLSLIKFLKNIYRKSIIKPEAVNLTIMLATAGIFVLFSYLSPYVYDDIVYHYCYLPGKSFFDIQPEITPEISSINDIFQSVKNVYFSWSGRTVSMFTVYFVFFCGKPLFNLLNGIIAVAVIYMICRHICGRKNIPPTLLLTISALFFLCAPSPGLTLFWANGAIIYLWSALFYLLLLYPYRMYLEYGYEENQSLFRKLYLMPIGIIGCNANENLAVSVIIVITLLIAFAAWKFHKVPIWMFYGLTGAVIGGLFLLLAPGCAGRVMYEGYQKIPVITNIFTQTAHIFHTIPCILATVISALIFYFKKFDSNQRRVICFYLLLILGTAYSMVFSPYTPGRAVFCTFIFILCCVGKILIYSGIKKHVRKIIAIATMCIAVMTAAFALRDVIFTKRILQGRFSAMQISRQKNEAKKWVFRPLCGISNYNVLYKTDIMREDPEHFLNRHYARQYKQISITLSPSPALQGMEQNIFPGNK